ncbi:hypothetical protein Pcinc_042639 [Petrolisthes cinctipes]|uniref:Uncharacterized protein n=1 Tax=Petrolisthes cinctipes TaxID=88211 RepID=A0AAE1BK87_PETCI|nr:hypothetical protein Pcinc_042639 [Petrolisthes cinctipes]
MRMDHKREKKKKNCIPDGEEWKNIKLMGSEKDTVNYTVTTHYHHQDTEQKKSLLGVRLDKTASQDRINKRIPTKHQQRQRGVEMGLGKLDMS